VKAQFACIILLPSTPVLWVVLSIGRKESVIHSERECVCVCEFVETEEVVVNRVESKYLLVGVFACRNIMRFIPSP
jgi:hypothetical protein